MNTLVEVASYKYLQKDIYRLANESEVVHKKIIKMMKCLWGVWLSSVIYVLNILDLMTRVVAVTVLFRDTLVYFVILDVFWVIVP